MSAELRARTYGDPVVIALRGELDDEDAGSIAACGPGVIADLLALEFIDCHALGALVRVQKAARSAGGGVLLAAPRKPVLRVPDLTGLDHVFCVYASSRRCQRRPPARATCGPAACGQHRAAWNGAAVKCRYR